MAPAQTIDLSSVASTIASTSVPVAPKTFINLVTLRHRITGKEACLRVETASDRFADVCREVLRLKSQYNLPGYEIFEVLSCDTPF